MACCFLGCLWTVLFPGIVLRPALADELSGHVGLTYTHLDTASKDSTGTASNSDINSFVDEYNLILDKLLSPNLRLYASGLLQRTRTDITDKTDASKISSTTTLERPYVDLTMKTPLYTASGNYNSMITETGVAGSPKTTTINESYSGYLRWMPESLPTLDLRAIQTLSYDKEHMSQNTVTDDGWLRLRYDWKNLSTTYDGHYVDARDKVNDTETKTVTNSGRVAYGDAFFDGRVSFSASYYASLVSTDFMTTGASGQILTPVFAFDGLFVSNTVPENISLHSLPGLIDNDVQGTMNNAINIGSSAWPLDTAPRNIGIRFGTASELNNLELWVYSVNNTGSPAYLSDNPTVPNSFKMDIYTSSDNQTWVLYTSVMPATYEPYAPLLGVGRFELAIPDVTTQYIKVVVSPLSPVGEALLYPGIYVTELKAFLNQSTATGMTRTSAGTIENSAVGTRVMLLSSPALFYDFTYLNQSTNNGNSTARNSSITNGLSVSHRFNNIFSGLAHAERSDTFDPTEGNAVTYAYNTSLQAVPLSTLRDSLIYSGSTHESFVGRTSTNSVFLNNNADLYRNFSIYLNGGVSVQVPEDKRKSTTSLYTFGASLAPLKTMTITYSTSHSVIEQSGGGLPDSTTPVDQEDMSLAYSPFNTLYLAGSMGTTSSAYRRNRTKSYGVSWSPFQGGKLQLGISYNEGLMTESNSTTRVLTSSIRWLMAGRSYAQVAYVTEDDITDVQQSTTRITTASLMLFF